MSKYGQNECPDCHGLYDDIYLAEGQQCRACRNIERVNNQNKNKENENHDGK